MSGSPRAHNRRRAEWAPAVATGRVNCWRCGYPIAPGEDWDLGHTIDRIDGGTLADTHPEHRHRTPNCIGNRHAGMLLGIQRRGQRRRSDPQPRRRARTLNGQPSRYTPPGFSEAEATLETLAPPRFSPQPSPSAGGSRW